MPRFIQRDNEGAFDELRPISTGEEIQGPIERRPTIGPRAFVRDSGAAVVGAVPDLADSVLASVSNFTPLDFERGTITRNVPIARQNPQAAEVASGAIGLIGSSVIAPQVTGAAWLNRAAQGSKLVRSVIATDRQVSRALAQVRRVDRAIAAQGFTGREALKQSITVAGNTVKRNAFANRARAIGAKRALTQSVATEALIAATLNENEIAFPDEAGAATLASFAALGIALPVGMDQIALGASMRRALQADEITRIRAGVLDAGAGVDEIKESASGEAIRQAREGEATANVPPEVLRFSGEATDEAALEAIQLKARRTATTEDEALRVNRIKASDVNLSRAVDSMSVATVRGINGVPESGFSMRRAASPEQQTVIDLLINDGLAVQGIDEIGAIPKGLDVDDVIEQRAKMLEGREQDALAMLVDSATSVEDKERATRILREIDYAKGLVPTVIEEGEILPSAFFTGRGDDFDGVINAVKGKRATDLGVPRSKAESTTLNAPQTGISLTGDTADIRLPKGKRLNNLDWTESQSLYALGRQFMDTLAEGRTFELSSKPSWFHLDLAEQMLRERPNSVNIKFPKGMTRESAQVESFAQKVAAVRALGDIDVGELQTVRRRLNLPGLSEIQRVDIGLDALTPAESLVFAETLTPAMIRKSSLSDLKRMQASARRREGTLAAVGPDESDLLGNSFREGFSPFVESRRLETAPVVAFRRPLGASILDRAAIENRRVESLATNVATLLDVNSSSPAVRSIVSQLSRDLDSQTLLDLTKLDDTTLTASIGNTRIRRGVFSQQNVAAAGNPTLLAAQRTFRKTSAFFSKDFDNFLDTPMRSGGGNRTHRQILGDIQRVDNTTSRLLVDQFTEARRGFQLDGALIRAQDGKFEFKLRNTEQNRNQYKLVTGRDMPKKDPTLPLLNGAPLGVDDAALEVIQSFSEIADKVRADKNAILKAAGLQGIKREPFYIPPQSNRFRAFIFDAGDNPIRQIQADSLEQLDRKIAAQRNKKDSFFNKQEGAKIFKEGEIRQQLSLLSRAQVDFLDPAIPFVQAVQGRTRTGAGASPFATGRNTTQVLRDFKNMSDSNTRELLEVMFKPQLDEARVRATGATVGDRATRESGTVKSAVAPSIANTYVSTLLGRRAIDSPSSTVGRVVGSIENALNLGIQGGYSAFTSLGGNRIAQSAYRKQFDKAVKELGDRTPFSSANEILEERGLFTPTPDIAQFASVMNDFATRIILRYDTAHAVINLAGVATTFPSVAASMLPKSGESFANVAQRLGRTANVFQDPNSGRVFTAWDVQKEMARSIKYMFNPRSHPDWDEAMRFGHLDAAVAEVYKELGQVHDAATWKTMARKADKYASFISDKSEEMAVAWAYFTSQSLLKRIGIESAATRGSMARQMTDAAIADFSPLNRPQIFQSPGIGSALGLFQTYMFNYYGRLFGYIENRQTRALATQMVWQSMVFGLNTAPGAQQYRDLVFNNSTGEQDPFDGIYARFSQPVADAIYYGVPSTIPLMFGGSRDDAPALSSRGDVDPRIPGTTQLPASISVIQNIFNGVGAGIELFRRDNPGISDQQVGEVLQRHVMNRPLSAIISMGWTDTLVDRTGNKVADETQSALGSIWRLMGLRTVKQTAEIEGNVRFRGAEALRLQRRLKLNRDVKALIRGGDLDDAKISRAFDAFIRTGGTPDEFAGFIKRNAEAGLRTETARALDRQLANPDKFDSRASNILRLYHATRDLREDANAIEDLELDETQTQSQ